MVDDGNILKQFQAEGAPWRQFFSDVQGRRQSLERTPFETGHHRGGNQGGSGGNPYKEPEETKT